LVYYRSAYSDVSMWENNSALLDPAKLLLAQGRYDQAQDWIFTVKPALKDDEVYAEAVFLMTRIYIISQQKEKAVQLLLKLKSKFRNSQMIPKCLLELMELYLEKGDTKDAEAAFTELDTQYGRTPEHELARNLQQPEADYSPLIDFYPLPYRFLGNTQPEIEIHADVSPQNEKQPASVSSTQGENPYHVCVGSFRVFENARQRQDELKSKGINSQISQKLIKNQTYYRVSVENSYNYEQAQHMIDTLKGLGYGESFIVKE
jgi:cell division protein FtsN